MESTDQRTDLEAEVARLRTVVDELRGRLDSLDAQPPAEGDGRRSRRDLLKVAGAAVAGVAGGVVLGAQPVAAATGDNMVLGHANDAGATTSLSATTSTTPSPSFEVIGPGGSVPSGQGAPPLGGVVQFFAAPATSTPAEAVDGWAPGGLGAGVQGFSDSGYGVVGQTSNGIDLAAYGSGRLFQFSLSDNSGPIAGPPPFTPAQPNADPNLSQPGGELMRDVNGVIWASLPTGTNAAAWRRMNSPRFDKADGSGGVFAPVRVIDTRPSGNGVTHQGPYNGPVGQGFYPVALAGHFGIPSDAVAVIGNLTAVAYSIQGYLAIFPTGTVYTPGSSPSSLNYAPPAYAWANSFTVGLGGGSVTVYVYSTQHFIIDIVGYIQ